MKHGFKGMHCRLLENAFVVVRQRGQTCVCTRTIPCGRLKWKDYKTQSVRCQLREFLLILLLSILVTAQIHAQPTLVLNTANAPPNSTRDHTGLGDRVVKEACARMGWNVEIVQLPSERALLNANAGIDDGNFARVEGIDVIYTNLIRVPEEITQFQFVAFSKKLSFKTIGWETLNPYNIAIVTGWKILETNIVNTRSLIKVKDESSLFRLLDENRADLVVYDMMQGLALCKSMDISDITVLAPPMAVKSMYIYLHKKHVDLVPSLTESIRKMKEDGTYKRIVSETIPEAFQQN